MIVTAKLHAFQKKHMTDRVLIDPPDTLYAIVSSATPLTRLAIFLHGLDGEYISSWGRLPYILRDNADSEPSLALWDFCFIGYQTYQLRSTVDVASYLNSWVDRAVGGLHPFGRSYDTIALVGHSLGGLAIRYYLRSAACATGGSIRSVSRAILIGEASHGSMWGDFAKFLVYPLITKPVISELTTGNGFAEQLRRWGHCAATDAQHRLCSIYTYRFTSELVVNPGPPFWAGDIGGYSLPGNHSTGIKVHAFTHPLCDVLSCRLS
jgi:pimeloyl-ACP methyl ester carboxylesterase